MERAKFVLIEGVGGAGKTTQAKLVSRYLNRTNRRTNVTREPGGVTSAEAIRRTIFEWRSKGLISPDQQVALFFIAREFWMREFVVPNLKLGINVVADRSYPSTVAYQGYAEGANLTTIKNLADMVVGKYRPDGIILIDVSAEVAKARNAVKNERDPYDEAEMAYYRLVVIGYREMAKNNWGEINWQIVDGERPIRDVARDVRNAVDSIIPGRK